MCAGSVEGNNTDFSIFLIQEQPIRIDMTLPIAVVITVQKMIAAFVRQWFIGSKTVNNNIEVS